VLTDGEGATPGGREGPPTYGSPVVGPPEGREAFGPPQR
jgi:hypothetical protein